MIAVRVKPKRAAPRCMSDKHRGRVTALPHYIAGWPRMAKSAGYFYFEEVNIMNQDELNTQLYEKMLVEQKVFTDDLLSLPPKEILKKAYEYTVREDIVLAMEDAELSSKQCKALLKSGTPLADVFARIQDRETDYMDTVRDALESQANEIVREEFKKSRSDAR